MTIIKKSKGENTTEKFVAKLCDNTFLKLWSYPNPFNSKGQELCDVLIIFENKVFIFSVKDIEYNSKIEKNIAWNRWKRKAIDESIKQVNGAERWIKEHPDKIYLDMKCTQKFPLAIPTNNIEVYKIIVALGAEKACKNDSPNNITGALAIAYCEKSVRPDEQPFRIIFDKTEKFHVLDSYNLDIILKELDTISDISQYFQTKENLINKVPCLAYCGEEDLLGNYLQKYKEFSNLDVSLPKDVGAVFVKEGGWQKVIKSFAYKSWKKSLKVSYNWDNLLQLASEYALNDKLEGSGLVFQGKSALYEMAKEPRNMRKILSRKIKKEENKKYKGKDFSTIVMPSNVKDVYYIILQHPLNEDNKEKREQVKKELSILCETFLGVKTNTKKIIGIAINSFGNQKYLFADFALLDCEHITDEIKERFKKLAREINCWS